MTNVAYRSCLLVLAVLSFMSAPSMSQMGGSTARATIPNVPAAHYVDPDVIDSEWNHHVAGYTLIASALLYLMGLMGQPGSRLSWSRSSWILLLIAAALFLALWSDKEIWPRGTLNWMWLIHHDAEARQHKIYAILLLAIALVEYFRQSGRLSHRWRTWAFPTLAFMGAGLLLMHTHDGHSGLPAGWDNAAKQAKLFKMAGVGSLSMRAGAAQTDIDPNAGGAAGMEMAHGEEMLMSPSQPGAGEMMATVHSGTSEHHHHHTITHIEEQHLWFAVLGMTLAVFKWVDDGHFWQGKFVSYLWPFSMITLGVLLVLYTEVK